MYIQYIYIRDSIMHIPLISKHLKCNPTTIKVSNLHLCLLHLHTLGHFLLELVIKNCHLPY